MHTVFLTAYAAARETSQDTTCSTQEHGCFIDMPACNKAFVCACMNASHHVYI